MITVKNLVKKFGDTVAVDDVSFDVQQGQLVGFLGPNGAGKTTTMRLLTGYLPPDGGSATLLDKNLLTDSLTIRRHLGYLPENNPLPDDIEVTDYLNFIGEMRGIKNPAERKAQIKRVIKLCSLKSVIGKKLQELSKGFRQRVGLAQAIIHDPDILILDEPTSGLDPNQVQKVRDFIINLKKHKTLIISTHILSEVQQTCDRILIINKGKIVGDGTPSTLSGSIKNANRLLVALKGPKESIEQELKQLPGILSLTAQKTNSGDDGFVVESPADLDLRESVFNIAVHHQWPVLSMNHERLSLEDVFRELTQEEKK